MIDKDVFTCGVVLDHEFEVGHAEIAGCVITRLANNRGDFDKSFAREWRRNVLFATGATSKKRKEQHQNDESSHLRNHQFHNSPILTAVSHAR